MKTFLAIYTGSPEAFSKWSLLSEVERAERQQAGMIAWHGWMDTHKDAVVEMGGPLGKTKKITATGVADVKNHMGGYTLIKAESHEAAAKLFENHPHFMIFPGEGVEVMECLPIPNA